MASEKTVELPRLEPSDAKRALIEARLSRQGRSSGIGPRAHRDGAPLSFAQERLWFLEQLEPASATYNMSVARRLGGALDEAVLERALGEVVRRHEVLRTVFREVDGSPVQVIAPFGGFTLPVEDLSGLGEAEREGEASRRAIDEARLPFDLAVGPLFRAALLRMGEEDHLLLLSMHHIVSDGWSIGVLLREIWTLYEAYRQGGEPPLPELPVQYADYAVWQREQLKGQALDRQLSYWRDRLAGAPELLELPTDRPRPPVQTFHGASERIELSGALLEQLQALGRSEGATLYMVVLSAFQVLLSRYSGSEDVVVGSPIAGRTRKEVAGLIGLFVNTLVLRTDLSGDPGFREVLGRVREVTLGAYEHQELPFEKLVAELQPERSLSHSPLFQVAFSLQDGSPPAGGGVAGLQARAVEAEFGTARFNLELNFAVHAQGLRGVLSYSTELFERGTIVRMLGHLERVLEQVAADADVRLSQLELLSAEERGRVVEEWNRTDAEYPADRCIHELFEAQAARTPDAVAVVFQDASLTYAELDARANRLAHHLAGLGAGPEARVGICVERSAEMVVAMLAVLKSGAAYLPLDPSYPADRLAYMLEDSGAPLLVTEDALRGLLPADGVRVVSIDADASAIAANPPHALSISVDVQNAAYVIYTSGSTGKPKGVQVTHGNAVNFFAGMDERVGGSAAGTWLAVTRISFDIHVLELLWTLARGFRVVVQPELDRSPDGESIAEQIRRHSVTHLQCTPSLAAMMIVESGIEALSGLERILLGGEALPSDLAAQITAVLPGGLVNMYGPTETTVWSATHAVTDTDGLIPIGRPIANTRVYVLDAALRPQPAGVPGELFIGGHGVARGYLGRPGLTAERFVPDAFSAQPGARLYRTGDRARWREESAEVRECVSAEVNPAVSHSRTDALTHSRTAFLEYLGRLDAQVKVRGFRIEPGEIEAVLRQAPGVADCAVVARTAAAGDTRLVAYVVGTADADALRAHAGRSLPDYMVPGAFVFLETLPLTPNGKLDRKALPTPELASAEGGYVAPRTPVEEVLAGIWAEVLRLERVGANDNFFDLGGHSLLATRVVSRVRELFGVELPLRALFEGPTVAGLAGRVAEMRRAGVPVLPAVVPTERTGALPLSFAQERLWFIDRMEPGGATYNIPAAWRLGGALDAAALERALGEVVRRHEALRTVFAEMDGSPVQVIAPFGAFSLPMEDLSGLGEADREAAVGRRAGEEASRPFDLAAGPLFRAALLRLGAEDHVLLLVVHHIVSDGWSIGVLFRELSALYEAYREGGESPLPELAVQYADFAVWQREQLAGEVLDRQLAYWKERLADAPALLELPTDHPRPAVQTYRGATVPFELSPELLERLQALGRSEGATLYMTLLAAFQVLLGKFAGSEDVVVGSPIAGRTRREVEELIGLFLNTLVLRTDLSGDPSFRETLRRVREATLGAYAHQEVPFEKLVAELQPERSLSHSPLFQVMFNLQDAGGGGALRGLSVSGVGAELASAKFDLSLTLTATAQGLRGGLNYSTDLFDRSTVLRMLGHLERVLEQVAADADVRLSRLELLSAEERGLVVDAWNRTAAEVPADRCIHELFEAQAARTPDAVAVVFEDASLTYAELNARANPLAHHLRSLGVGPEVRVGICLERSLEMMVSLLSVLKAGGAYVPLDPGLPAERLAYMLDDSAVPLVLVQAALREAVPAREAVEVLAVDALAERLASEPAENPESGAGPDSLAYVIYTSGSTGRPKGVMNHHGGVVNLLWSMRGTVGIGSGDRLLAITTLAFDISVLELFLPLLSGARVEILARSTASDPDLLRAAVAAGGETVLQATPATWRLLLDAGWEGAEGLRALSGGEALPAELAARLRERVGALWNVYGPTETTIWSTAQQLDAAPDEGRGHISIGAPVANTRVYVLDRHLSPVPAGVPGELYIGGAGVARGYLGRPGLSAEKFVPDPFSAEPGARLYRTGDRVRWVEESAEVGSDFRTNALTHSRTAVLEFLGRNDHQVKVRGFRIELGEIEAALGQVPGVADCAVAVREDEAGDRRLVAYVVGDAEADALRDHLRRTLPEYMVPSVFVALETLPLTPNGKLDRKALPAPELASTEDRYVAPRTPTEEVLAGIWAEVLRLERVGVEESFFSLGGHSLLAVRVISRVRQALGVEASLRDVFERPVLADFARGLATAARAEATAIEPVDRSSAIPLSFAQQRLWFLEQFGNLGGTYHIPMSLRLRGELDHGALVRSLDRIVARHEALRTSFPMVDGGPVQHVAPVEESGFRLVEHDLRASADAEDELRRLVQDEASAPFDLAQGPLIRGRLVRMAADDQVLLITMHHIVSDGWSMGIFTHELSTLYGACRDGRPDPLSPLPVQYADYTAWQRRWVEGPVLEAQAEYWTGTLAGAPDLLELPTDHPRPAKQSFAGAALKVELDEALTAALRTLSQRHGTTLFMTLLAGWAAVLARLSGQDDVVIGTPSANRGRSEIEGLIGVFVNTLPLRVDFSGAPTVAEVLGRVKARALEAQQNQDIPFEQVVELVKPARSMAHTPLFQVMFTWQNAPEGSLELPGLALGPLHPAGAGGSTSQVNAKFDLSLTLREDDGRIVGGVAYATALFDQATVERHVGYLCRVLDEMVADDAKQVHRVDLLSAAERRVVVEEWNATDAAFPAGACVHELFQDQVERTPGAVALSFAGARLTYAELNARANRLAHHLRALGVGPEVRAAVCMKRGFETVLAMLAVLKAGGVYVPLDPGQSDDRLRYSLGDCAPAALLTWGPVAAAFAGTGVSVVDLDNPAAWDAYPASDPDRTGVGPEHLAYAIYTSGSTGRPKGVAVRHGSLVSLLANTRAAFGVGPGDVLPALAPSAFDISLFELLLPLVSGAELRLVPPPRVSDPRALLGEIADATLLSAVPTLMHDIVQVERRAQRLARVRGIFVGGEQVPAELLAEMSTVFPAARTYVVYGPTEATVLASAHAVPADGAVSGYPIGRPLGNVRLYVCDAFGEPQPVGVAGELLIGGAGVARGYLGRPALTAEHFVPDPFSAVPGARLYRSGDRVRRKESGVLDFLGRTDFQVQIRGIRVELGEIEARLREHPAVRQAVVTAREDAPGKKRLVAYVVGEAPAEALMGHLGARLPGYMVPGAYVRLEALPLTGNGKLDRGALPAPDGAAYARRAPEPPRTMGEQVLAGIWAEVLGVPRVDRRAHFFDLGGHSMLAVRMVALVREALNPAATVEDVFAYPTLYELAARLQGSGEWYGTSHAIPIRETGSERPLFVVHDVVGIVFYGQLLRPHLDAEIPIYALPGPLNDTDPLASLDDLVTRLVRMITEVQPEGPVRLAGWSAGGSFAYAVAERLVNAGRAVEFVGLLDTFHPRLTKLDPPGERPFTVLELLARDTGVAPATPEALQALKEDTEGLDLPAFIATCKARGLLPETVTLDRAERMYDRIGLLKRSHGEYVPGPLPVPVYVFSSDEAPNNPRRGWEDLPGGVPIRMERVPGTHHTIWKKGNVEVVGAAISRAIREAAAG